MSAGPTPDIRSHQYSEERVKSMNDPEAQAGLSQMRALFPPYRRPNAAPLAQAPNAAPPAPQAAAPQQQLQPEALRFEQPTAPQASTQAGPGGAFKRPGQCTAGTRVTDKNNKSGTVIGIEGHERLSSAPG
jgi:hypothetical protein